MATAIYFGGRRLNVPQAVTKIDASALAAVSPTASGIVALIGVAEGGAPLTVDESLADATQPSVVAQRYRSGDLRTAGLFAFEPSGDPAVPGGAQKEILVKVNPSTGSGIALPDDNAAEALDITSKDSGLFTNQINIDVEAGTTHGLKYQVAFEGNTEVFDDIGGVGTGLFELLYASSPTGYTTALARVTSTSFVVTATKVATGLASDRANPMPAPGVVSAVSSGAGDTTQKLTVYGLSGTNTLLTEVLSLNGTIPVVGAVSFTKVLAVRLSAAAAGTVVLSDSPVTTTVFSIAPAVTSLGLVDTTDTPAAAVLHVSTDADVAANLVVLGTTAAGAATYERFNLATANSVPLTGSVVFGSLTTLLLGDVPNARSVTVQTDAVITLHSQFTTVAKVVDRLNALPGFTATALVSNYTTFLMVDADYHTAPARPPISVLGVTGVVYADLHAAAVILTAQSQYVNAARAPSGKLPPAVTSTPVFLSGGSEGTPTITEWQTAFKLLEKRRYNILVPLTRDPAVHSLALSHLIAKAGRLKSEANGYVGIGKADGSGETRSALQSQIQALNTRHLSAISQEVEKFDPISGSATFYPPYILAAVAAGMQAGSAIAEPLTRKTMIATNLRNDPSWDVTTDVSDLIDRGLMLAEKVDGVGVRWVRSITTHLADDNLAFVEMSANESLITFIYEFRNALEKKIGSRGLGGTVGQIKSLARAEANRLVDEEIIFGHRALQIDQIGDVFPVSIEVALIDPVNFIPITIHLTPSTSSAAA